jgi:alanine dehydrogenase
MEIGVPREIKNSESRVGMTPNGAAQLVRRGHHVVIERGAGTGAGFPDTTYEAKGARLGSASDVWSTELVVKVKEPIEAEYSAMRSGQLLFTYLHLAADPELTAALLDRKVTSIAYEAVQLADGSLPLLAPMSEVAGRLSVMVGSYHLMGSLGGAGVLLGGVPGVRPAKVVVIGGGFAGRNAIGQAVAMGADVTVLDLNVSVLRGIDDLFQGRVRTVVSDPIEIENEVLEADLVIGAVLVPGRRAPRLVTRETVAGMKPGSVLVDIAIDQGGCFEDSHPTTHADPIYRVENSLFYCVANMPGAVAATSTRALTNVTLPYVLRLADAGWGAASAADAALAGALSTAEGRIVHDGTADAHPHLASVGG